MELVDGMVINKEKTKKFEWNGVIQDIHIREKGTKNCDQPHTKFTILTPKITHEEMNELVFGGCNGAKVCLKIEVVKEK